MVLSAGQMHDCKAAERLINAVRSGQNFLADRAYDTNLIRSKVNAQGARITIPPKSLRKGALLPYDQRAYAKRNIVERFFNKVKQYRGLATRYDKRPEKFMGGITLLAIRLWARYYESTA
jgi:transposase